MIQLMILVLYVLLLSVALFFIWRLKFAFTHFKMKQSVSVSSMLKDLPSVSVCIPARNETHAMTQCLERVIASTYPKLEIIVLDDSSVDDTSFLIKSFAHEGVRFVEGSPLPAGWLGKNHALEGLLREASGSYILFMDVDTLIEPDTIEQLVAYAEKEKAAMVSVLPRRTDRWRASVIFTTLRHFWELILHRASAPAVASNAWMIQRDVLERDFGGFEKYKNDVRPEVQLATSLASHGRYRFIISTRLLGVSYEKRHSSQIETSVRLLFPALGNSMIRSMLVLLLFICMSLPLFIILSGFFTEWSWIQLGAAMILATFMLIYGRFLAHIWNRAWWIGACLWPVILLQECVVLLLSIIRYKRRQVTWKGRPVAMTE